MKTLLNIGIILFLASLTACSTTYSGSSQTYDDIYYSPNNDPVKVAEKKVDSEIDSYQSPQYENSNSDTYSNEDKESEGSQNYNNNSNYDYYQKEYSDEITTEPQYNPTIQNGNTQNSRRSYDDYYDYEYAARLRRFHSPYVGAGYYDDFYTNRYYYDNTPPYYAASIYGGSSIYDPYPYSGVSIGYSSYVGWGVSFGFGFGWGFSSYYPPFYYGSPFYYSYYNPYRFYGYYSPFAYNYYHGYHHGFQHGYHHGYHDGYYGSDSYSSSYRNISGPRSGRAGTSTSYKSVGNTSRPARGVPNSNIENNEIASPVSRPKRDATSVAPVRSSQVRPQQEGTRPERPTSPVQQRPEARPIENRPNVARPGSEGRTTETRPIQTPRSTPEEYRPKSRQEYERPQNYNQEAPVRELPNNNAPSRSPSQRPTYVRPDNNNSYNRQPTSPPKVQPKINTRPSPPRQQSRPSYNRDNSYSMPSRSNSGGSYGGGSSTPSSRPSRPGR